MKVLKLFLILFIAVFFSGCYTQLQYSQKMKKITDEEKESVYSWNDEEEREDSTAAYSEEYLPMYYKDYEYRNRFKDCACLPYNVYNFYGNDWYDYDPYFSYRSSFFSPWHYPRYWGYSPGFSLSFSWGWGDYYQRYYDPFFDPYHYYWYGSRPYAFRYRYFYGAPGYYYGNDSRDRTIRYAPRSIGTNRVATNGNRTRSVNSADGRNAAAVTKSKVRTRSVGTARTQSATDRNTGSTLRTRSRTNSEGNKSSSTRTRSREDNLSYEERYPIYIDRTNEPQRPVIINKTRLRSSQSGAEDISTRRNSLHTVQRPQKSVRERSTFFNRLRSFFEDNTSGFINNDRNRGRTIRSRSTSSSSNRSAVSRSKSKNRSSVTRSRSSSSNSRSSGSSSRSRSGGGNSGSDRSRDN